MGRTVPSPTDPGPHGGKYFSGGYITRTYSSKLDAIQIELPSALRSSSPQIVQEGVTNLAAAVLHFMSLWYDTPTTSVATTPTTTTARVATVTATSAARATTIMGQTSTTSTEVQSSTLSAAPTTTRSGSCIGCCSIAPWETPAMAAWCQANCGNGYCPKTHCSDGCRKRRLGSQVWV